MSSYLEDDIIRYRLLIDGEGSGDDKRINMLIKNIMKWPLTNKKDERDIYYEKVFLLFEQSQLSLLKLQNIFQTNLYDQKIYLEQLKDIENNTKHVTNELGQCQNDLRLAKIIKKNRLEYDKIAKIIVKHPDRNDKNEKQLLDDKFSSLKKQFSTFLYLGYDLYTMLRNDTNIEMVNDESNVNEKSDKEMDIDASHNK
ncbi:THO complex subunit 7 homolog isoform X2 [Gordionus sp. m RMFG-2023]|uniref:THO complex subunit 7 homolog isoform X2 n=1 Tax=Gordionus sp. m RMFG-2023 TaxID=3053472 RepID=UPI0031FCCC2E